MPHSNKRQDYASWCTSTFSHFRSKPAEIIRRIEMIGSSSAQSHDKTNNSGELLSKAQRSSLELRNHLTENPTGHRFSPPKTPTASDLLPAQPSSTQGFSINGDATRKSQLLFRLPPPFGTNSRHERAAFSDRRRDRAAVLIAEASEQLSHDLRVGGGGKLGRCRRDSKGWNAGRVEKTRAHRSRRVSIFLFQLFGSFPHQVAVFPLKHAFALCSPPLTTSTTSLYFSSFSLFFN